MKIAARVTDLIGHTPLLRLNKVVEAGSNEIIAKLEQFNPGLSVKDRPALRMIEDAEERGLLKPGMTIIEATSGNTGIALGVIAASRGYRLIITLPESMSYERQQVLRLLGAQVELTPAHLGMEGAIQRAEELHGRIPGAFLVRQFCNRANAEAHERTTAKEILEDTDGRVDVFVAGVGTGGTLTGVARALKARCASALVVAVEPADSPVLSGGKPGPHAIQGIGPGFVPEILDRNLIDEIVTVSDAEAAIQCRRLARTEGVLAGISSGAALAGVAAYLKKHKPEGKRILVMFPDAAERNLSVLLHLKVEMEEA